METLFDIRPCGPEDYAAVRALEETVLATLQRPDLLRRNSEEMWRACLQAPHYCLGAWVGEELVALAVLYVPSEGDKESLAPLLRTVDSEGLQTANYKICIVHPRWRGYDLLATLGQLLRAEAVRRGIGLLCATASPHNTASVRGLERLGYKADSTLFKYGFERILFYRFN